jgi:hypothetical protein
MFALICVNRPARLIRTWPHVRRWVRHAKSSRIALIVDLHQSHDRKVEHNRDRLASISRHSKSRSSHGYSPCSSEAVGAGAG